MYDVYLLKFKKLSDRSSSLKVKFDSTFGFPYIASYWYSIVIYTSIPVFSEIEGLNIMSDIKLSLSTSYKLKSNDVTGLSIYHSLLTVNTSIYPNSTPIKIKGLK